MKKLSMKMAPRHGTMKGITMFLIGVVEVGLFAMIAIRETTMVNRTIQGDAWYMGIAGVFALSGGVVCWYLAFAYLARNPYQQAAAAIMWVISFIGSAAAVLLESFIESAEKNHLIKPDAGIITAVVAIVSVVILANVAAGVIFHLLGRLELDEQPTALPRPTYSAQVMPPVAFPQALENPPVAEVTTTKRQLPERTRNLQTAPRIVFRTEKVKVAKPEPKQAAYTLDNLLQSAGMSKGEAKAMCLSYALTTPDKAYNTLKTFGKVPKGMTLEQARPLFQELFS